MLKKNKKLVYVVLDDDNVPLYVNKSIRKIGKFVSKTHKIFNHGTLKLSTIDEYNKTHSEETMIDNMFKEWMNSRGNK